MLPHILLLSCLLAPLLPATWAEISQPVGGPDAQHAAKHPSVYIIHVRKPEHMLSAGPEVIEEWHKSFLPSPTLDSGKPRMVYSYKVVISGFAARLTAEEVRAMENKEGFLYAQPDEELTPETTHSPDFLSLRPNVWRAANRGKGCIIGVVDTGIDPDHASFVANQIPDPAGWSGWCYFSNQRTCNAKLIGAAYPVSQSVMRPPVDQNGHGTHVAGIASGMEVPGANIYGYAQGIASGAAPDTYLAIYGAPNGGAEILRSMEQAIEDGVHIISISMGRGGKVPFYSSSIAKGALAAVRRGILVASSAGNRGPDWCTVGNDAPWIMTVGASTMGRALRWNLTAQNGVDEDLTIPGESLHGRPTITGDIVFPGANRASTRYCYNLAGIHVAQKIVMCYTSRNIAAQGQAGVVRQAGGAALVLMNSADRGSIITDIPDGGILPVIAVNNRDAKRLIQHVGAARRAPPRVELIHVGTLTGVAPFPAVPFFSSRGPSLANGGIVKPDILGPGVNILSARLNSRGGFTLMSGTSMATPHLSGIAAILKQHLPAETGLDWSPAMIRSSIMTTAETSNRQGNPITDETDQRTDVFSTGAGHVNPAAALDPGLVYDVSFDDYVRYLCGLGYTNQQVEVAADVQVDCAEPQQKLDPEQLNYPTVSVVLNPSVMQKTIERTVTYVRSEPSIFKAEVILDLDDNAGESPVAVTVDPDTLDFTGPGDRRTFRVTFTLSDDADHQPQGSKLVFVGKLRWASDTHTVTSRLHITFGGSQTEVYGCP